MNVLDFILRKKRAPEPDSETDEGLDVIDEAPPGVWWREVRPRGSGQTVTALGADRAGVLSTPRGPQAYSVGDYIVSYGGDDEAVVRQDIFERTYRRIGEGVFRKRTDIVLRYFTLDRAVLVRGLEGLERAEAGDWIVEGVAGELWPIAAELARAKYQPV